MSLSNFVVSSLGLLDNSHAIEQIGVNVSNVSTTGYKAIDTRFKSLMGDDNHTVKSTGVNTFDRRMMDATGNILPSDNPLHVAIDGGVGLFAVNTASDGNGETLFTRAGDFVPLELEGENDLDEYYLGTASGLFVLGFPVQDDGTYATDMQPINITPATQIPGLPSTAFDLRANLPSNSVGTEPIGITLFDGEATPYTASMNFVRTGMTNEWNLNFVSTDGVNFLAPAHNATSLNFDTKGNLIQPTAPVQVQVEYPTGEIADITFDISEMTQYSGSKDIDYINQDGIPAGSLSRADFNESGEYIARYSNGVVVNIAKLALVDFNASQNLEAVTGNLFRNSSEAGEMLVLNTPGDDTDTRLRSFSLENSNVDIGDQFTRMITIQNAYSSNATSFQTADEMLENAINIKT